MNDTERAVLVEELEAAVAGRLAVGIVLNRFSSRELDCVKTGDEIVDKAVMPIIDRLLTTRPEPAADAVHAVHEALVNSAPGWIIDREDGELLEMARAALTAVPTVQAAAGDDLDAMLNNIHPNTTASLQFIQPYLTTDPEPYWQAHVSVPTGGLTGFQKHRGTGPTRIAAIQNAVEKAKEQG